MPDERAGQSGELLASRRKGPRDAACWKTLADAQLHNSVRHGHYG